MREFLKRRGEGVVAPLELHLLSPGGLEGRFVGADWGGRVCIFRTLGRVIKAG